MTYDSGAIVNKYFLFISYESICLQLSEVGNDISA